MLLRWEGLLVTKRADKIIEYHKRLSMINEESDKYDEVYEEFKAYLNSDEDKEN